MSNLSFIPYEFPRSSDGQYLMIQQDHQVLLTRREQLGLTQQQVADMAHIQLRQYQRIESGERHISGCSLNVGLAVCAVLLLNPYDFITVDIQQPDGSMIRPQQAFDVDLPPEVAASKRAGRKPIRRDTMTVYLNHPIHALIIPWDVLDAIGKPQYIQFLYHPEKNRIAVRAATAEAEEAIDVPDAVYEGSMLVIVGERFSEDLRKDMGWTDALYAAEARLVRDSDNRIAFVVDTCKATETERIHGPFVIPNCMDDEISDGAESF